MVTVAMCHHYEPTNWRRDVTDETEDEEAGQLNEGATKPSFLNEDASEEDVEIVTDGGNTDE